MSSKKGSFVGTAADEALVVLTADAGNIWPYCAGARPGYCGAGVKNWPATRGGPAAPCAELRSKEAAFCGKKE